MNKVKTIYEGVFVLGFMFLIVASFLCLVLSGICTPDWVIPNVIWLSATELVLVVWAIIHIRKGSVEILKETRSLMSLKDLYERVMMLSGFGIIFGLIQLFFFSGLFSRPEDDFHQMLFYAFNVIGVSVLFFVWMWLAIRKINKRMRY